MIRISLSLGIRECACFQNSLRTLTAVNEMTLPVEEFDLSRSLLGDSPNEAAEDQAVDGIEGIPVKQSE